MKSSSTRFSDSWSLHPGTVLPLSFGYRFWSGSPHKPTLPTYAEALKLCNWVANGIFQDYLFLDKSKTPRWLTWERLLGSMPKSWFFDRLTKFNICKCKMSEGISPVKLFLESFSVSNPRREVICIGIMYVSCQFVTRKINTLHKSYCISLFRFYSHLYQYGSIYTCNIKKTSSVSCVIIWIWSVLALYFFSGPWH